MKLFIERASKGVNAVAEYNKKTKSFTVLKGSKVSDTVAHSERFRGASSIEKSRSAYVKEGVVTCDVPFKSASTAANFVTGTSTNGLTAWKDKGGKTLKELLSDTEEK